MKNSILYLSLLGAMLAAPAIAQTLPTAKALQQSATGESFTVGQMRFRVVPDAVLEPSAAKAQATPAIGKANARQQPAIGKYTVKLGAAKSAAAVATGGDARMAVAMSDSGVPVVVTSSLDVYVSHIGALNEAVRDTGGKLKYSSALGGNGVIEYASVAQALQAMQKLSAIAGVKSASPRLIREEFVLY
ncbi:hypothetical protein [Lysobacter enzymogenes]|uniref:hypothetical protein n=1 Tax=Lysobacter enzymogenes TaxID=69 RepID=UPI001AFA6D5A|nr:hypothetical protein [Lysobacter enzymogenes]QQQ02189.1 hypothetical protein JHW41_04155 [Lysobacter enzymogenes]